MACNASRWRNRSAASKASIAHPATMTHASMSAEARRTAGIGDALLRLSVGIEDGADLCADLDAALARAQATLPARKVRA